MKAKWLCTFLSIWSKGPGAWFIARVAFMIKLGFKPLMGLISLRWHLGPMGAQFPKVGITRKPSKITIQLDLIFVWWSIVLSSSLCPLYNNNPEDTRHVLAKCLWVNPIWVSVFSWWHFGAPTGLHRLEILRKGTLHVCPSSRILTHRKNNSLFNLFHFFGL